VVEQIFIEKYFQNLTEKQRQQFILLEEGIADWNTKINVISRKDADNIVIHHILHSLSIFRFVKFNDNADILDLGTGGGFPGLPLAIMQPNVNFVLLDSRKKKLFVIDEICKKAQIKNVTTVHARVEEHTSKYDFVVTRAVAKSSSLLKWTKNLIKKDATHGLPNGLIALKGGDLKEELLEVGKHAYYESRALKSYFEEEFFETKCLVYLQH